MQEHKTFPGKIYAVTCASGCTITDNAGRTLGECEAGKQTLVVATSDMLLTSADSLVTATFNSAPAKLMALGLLGGGDSLPAGYLAAEFLESTGTQYIDTGYVPNNETGAMAEFACSSDYQGSNILAGMRANQYDTRWALPTIADGNYGGWGALLTFGAFDKSRKTVSKLNWLGSREALLDQGEKTQSIILENLPFVPVSQIGLYGMRYPQGDRNIWVGRIFTLKLSQGVNLVQEFIAVVDSMGVPCMYDKVSKQPFYNSGTGAFVVGMTLEQARKLSKLPATGGTLTISLPTGYEADEGVVNALETARGNGWTLTVQTYETEDATASTYALRRVWVRRTQAENGTYVDADGTRWQVEWCVDMLTPDGSTPDAHGYELYRSQEAAVAYWGLEPWVDPNAEQEEHFN